MPNRCEVHMHAGRYKNPHGSANIQTLPHLYVSLMYSQPEPQQRPVVLPSVHLYFIAQGITHASLYNSFSILIIVISSLVPTVLLRPFSLSYFIRLGWNSIHAKIKIKIRSGHLDFAAESSLAVDGHAAPENKTKNPADQRKAITFMDGWRNWPYPVSI